jgi:PhnB protein
MAIDPIPAGQQGITPCLVVGDANDAIAYYERAFDAKLTYRLDVGDKVAHAEMRMGQARFMLSDEFADWDAMGPESRGGTTCSLMVYVDDVDAAFERAIKAGASVMQPVENQFWGDRMGTLIDPFGHRWMLGTHVEDVDEDEMRRRGEEWVRQYEAEG